ncbi:MAG: ABC transporter ATP-binding protein [Salinarimonas sp.]|nr:ABC transporter ATP-binding protein [Salinarimonas sp.]
MAHVSLRGLTRIAGGKRIVDDFSLEVPHGACQALLGPSGCGKTTILRLLAGFETLDAGEIRFDDDIVARPGRQLEPEERRVGMVFQSYALWPHLDVAGNVDYALRVRKVARAERAARVAEALEIVGLPGFAERKVQSLSGGQRQRVALARCLAMRPRLVLLDEPLANLDAHLRETMIDAFRTFHAASGATMIYVTHDQAEAMALADRIAVMDSGRLRQVDSPVRLYDAPADAMVARFIGQGQLVPVDIIAPAGEGRARVRVFGHEMVLRCSGPMRRGQATACLRPDAIAIASPAEGAQGSLAGGIAAHIRDVRFEGASRQVRIAPEAAPQTLLTLRTREPVPAAGTLVKVTVDDGWILPQGAEQEAETAPVSQAQAAE